MASYARLGAYLCTDELAMDPFGGIHRGLTIVGSKFDKHFLVRSYSRELLDAGLGGKVEAMHRLVPRLEGIRHLGRHCRIEGKETPLLAMDYVPGRSLAQVIGRATQEQLPIEVDQVLTVAQALAQALAQLHSQGLSHGLLSPHSVWIGFDGSIQVLDAPCAAACADLLARCTVLSAALVPYRSAGGDPFQRDLFSLGAILFELLTLHRLPVHEQIPGTWATLEADREGPPLPRKLKSLLECLLQVGLPFESVDAFRGELEQVLCDGDGGPSTFTMAFLMHALFREELLMEERALEEEAAAVYTPPPLCEPESIVPSGASGRRKRTVLVAAGLAIGLLGGFGYWGVRARMAALEKARVEQVEQLNLQIQQGDQANWVLVQDTLRLKHEEEERVEALERARLLAQRKREREESLRRRAELLKRREAPPQMNPSGDSAPEVAEPKIASVP